MTPSSTPRVLLDRAALQGRVRRLATEIAHDHPEGVVLVGVLKGSLLFLADLARAITTIPVAVDVLAISRYAPDSGRVRILKDLDVEVEGRDVVVVEDLVDTGLTLAYLLRHVGDRSPRSVDVCTLLDRTERRIVPLAIRYVGEQVAGDAYVLGYGLHHGERYRNLPVVVMANRTLVTEDPETYLGLYAGGWRDLVGEADGRVVESSEATRSEAAR